MTEDCLWTWDGDVLRKQLRNTIEKRHSCGLKVFATELEAVQYLAVQYLYEQRARDIKDAEINLKKANERAGRWWRRLKALKNGAK
jgi:hypothetical protein